MVSLKRSISTVIILTSLLMSCSDDDIVGRAESHTFESESTGKYETVFIYYPEEHTAAIPVIYLLNGMGADASAWGSGINLARQADRLGVMLVSLTAGFNQYVNHPSDSSKQMADFVLEVVTEVESLYGIEIVRQNRALCGISNGGGGAIYLLSHYSNRFQAAGCLSGSVYTGINFEGLVSKGIRIDVGTEDTSVLTSLRWLDGKLRDEHINHAYYEHAGGHNWDFWKKYAPEQLEFLQERIAVQ